MKTIPNHIKPWLFVVAAFALLLGAWTSLVWIAMKHTPQRIEVQSSK